MGDWVHGEDRISGAEAESAPNLGGLSPMLASKYRVLRRIGEGGMGVVYAGDHLELKSRVAIKVLQPTLARDETARARFLREARLAASIEGEHSTRIHDVATDADGRWYMVMEYLAGESVKARLSRERRMPLASAATVLVQLLDVLAEAHAKGLVHRDLKPANLFLVDRPGEPIWVKVLDFGISKLVTPHGTTDDSSDVILTAPRTLLGSPAYMAPEQLRDAAVVDARSDLWACGVLFFEMLTGHLPFEGNTVPELYARILESDPRPLASDGGSALPAAVARIIERCLRKVPGERPQTAHELAVAIAPYAHESVRSLLPRIRAWCKSNDLRAPPALKAPARLISGMMLVALSGILAFIVASLRAPGRSVSRTGEPSAAPTASGFAGRTAVTPMPVVLQDTSPQASPRLSPPDGTGDSLERAERPLAGANAPPPRAPLPVSQVPTRRPPTAGKPSPPPQPKPPADRIQDIDGIELLR